MAARTRGGGLGALLADITRKHPAGLLARGLQAHEQPLLEQPQEDRERKGPPPGMALAAGVVDVLRSMPGALELIRDEVRELRLLSSTEQHKLAMIAQVVREACRRYGVPCPRGCDWGHAVRLLYPNGAKGDWRSEANLAAQERGLNPLWRWERENPLLTEDEEHLAQVLVAALRGDGQPLLALVENVAARLAAV